MLFAVTMHTHSHAMADGGWEQNDAPNVEFLSCVKRQKEER